MSRVRYAKSMRDIERGESDGVDTDGLDDVIRTVRVVYETDAEFAQAVVPKPLEVSVGSEVCVSFASVATHVTPDVTIETRSASFGVRVDYDGKTGSYLLVMPMASEHAVLLGRERFGEPAKLAELRLETSNDGVAASATRKGVRILSVEGRRVEELGPRKTTDYGYSFKAYPSCVPDKLFDQDPQLVRLKWLYEFSKVWRLEGDFELGDSPFDPVADLPVRRIVEFEYAEGTVQRSGRALRPVPGDWLVPFIHQRYDDPAVEGVDV